MNKMAEHACAPIRQVARYERADLEIDDHGILMLSGGFRGDGWGQGFGYQVDESFIRSLLAVFKVYKLQDINNKPCYITSCSTRIHRIDPLFSTEGTTFDIDVWAGRLKSHSESA
jgi:hypothetical protein